MKKIVLACFLTGFSLSCTSNAEQKSNGNIPLDSIKTAQTSNFSTLPDTITIAMTGDIMMGTTYPKTSLPPNDGKDLFNDTKTIISNADLAVGNLEGAICEGGTTTKEGPNSYAFRTPVKYGINLKDAGYDFLSMANNHANDFGTYGIESSEKVLDEQGIKYAGVDGRTEYAIIERKGLKFGICAFGHNSYTIQHTDTSKVISLLKKLRPLCDIMIVSFHGGAEGSAKTHLPHETEIFLGENRGNLREFTHLCIDNGADVVYGHGPHVVRCIETYKGKFIAYSLGNFCTPYGMLLTGGLGYAPVVEIKINGKGNFLSGKINSFIQKRGIGPRKDPTNSAAKEIKALTLSDIENPAIIISDKGEISVK
jgi:poly-gamma-glutamate capsule biosynthesis protein CapA/YwtB (metallophosphatase superfamily)